MTHSILWYGYQLLPEDLLLYLDIYLSTFRVLLTNSRYFTFSILGLTHSEILTQTEISSFTHSNLLMAKHG